MKNKLVNKIIIVVVLFIFIISQFMIIAYAADYDTSEFTNPAPASSGSESGSSGGESPIPDSSGNTDVIHYVPQTKLIYGYIYEKVEATNEQEVGGMKNNEIQDSSNNLWNKPIKGLTVKLYMDGAYTGMTCKTNSEGYYKFNVYGITGEHKYQIEYTYPAVTESQIEEITTVEEAKEIQEKLKYNGQDYHSYTGKKKSTIELSGKGVAQVFLLLDCSISMNEKIKDPENPRTKITKLELEKRIASSLVEDLLADDKNVLIGLVVFRGQVYRKVSLTNDKDLLLNAINGDIEFTYPGYTNIEGALIKAYNSFGNNSKTNSNRYMFILSDGLPTADDAGWPTSENKTLNTNHMVYTPDGSEAIEAHNIKALKLIANSTRDKIKELEKDGVTIYSLIAKGELSESGEKRLHNIYDNGNKNNKYKEVESYEEIKKDDEFFEEFKEYVKESVKITDSGYSIDTETRGDIIIENYSEFKNKNTKYFEALDMDIKSSNIETFKKYAKKLIEDTKVTVKTEESTAEFQNGTVQDTIYHKDEDGNLLYKEIWVAVDANIKAPNSYLERLQPFTITPVMTVTGMSVIAQNGMELSNDVGPIDTKETLYSTVDEEALFGSKVRIEFTINIKNDTVFNNGVGNLSIIAYIPDGFEYDESGGIKIIESKSSGNVKIDAEDISYVNINSKNIDIYQQQNPGVIPNNGKIEQYIKEGHNAIIINIKSDNKMLKEKNGEVQIKLCAIKFLSYDNENTVYKGDAEILSYSNGAFRRLQYKATEESSKAVQTSGLNGAVAGNMDTDEEDYAESNEAVVLVPTGDDRSMKKIYIIMLTLMAISAIDVIIIQKEKNKHLLK